MKYLFSSILIVDGIIALYICFQQLLSAQRKEFETRVFSFFALSSCIWSSGFGLLLLQTNEEYAYICRSIGILGTIFYIITCQMMLCRISMLSKKISVILNTIAFSGIIVYFLSIERSQTSYMMSTFGMTYKFHPGIVNTLYTGYFVLNSLNMLGIILYMIHFSILKRIQTYGRRFFLVTILILLGTILDMVFPAIGLPALPGSNVTQFFGLLIIKSAMNTINRTKINIANMSEFIYYSLAMPVLVYDSHENPIIFNDAASDFFQVPQEALSKENAGIDCLFSAFPKQVFCFPSSHLSIDTTTRHTNTPCSLAISKITDTYHDIIGYIIIVTDLSERMQYIHQLEIARQEADSSNMAKSRFLANMSHEIRTPMNAIVGYSELALKSQLTPELTDYMKDIKTSSLHLLSLINDILDFSKIESGKMELINVSYDTTQLFHDVTRIIQPQAEQKGLQFDIHLDKKLPSVLFGDTNKIRSILVNLLTNAVKYTPSGTIALDARIEEMKDSAVSICFVVSDTGIGIKEESLATLFDSFTRADAQRNYSTEGTGLGLSLVKGFTELMKGTVSVTSTYGEGSVFSVTILQDIVDATPIASHEVSSEEPVDDFSLGNMKIRNLHVLLVDDNSINLKVISSGLKFYGIDVETADSGAKSIALCRDNAYDIVFMDQMMPEMDGIEAMHKLRTLPHFKGPNAPGKIVALTANAIDGVRDSLLAEGFDEYLTKPVNYTQLEQVLCQFVPPENISYQAEEVTHETVSLTGDRNTEDTVSSTPSESLTLSRMLPSVDVAEGIAHCGNDADCYLEVLQLLLNSGADTLEKIVSLFSANDLPNYTIEIHALKGTCYNIGAKDCGDLAKELEFAGRNGDMPFISSHLDAFSVRFQALLSELEAALQKQGIAQTTPKESGQVHLFDDVQRAVDEMDFAKAAALCRDAQQKDTHGIAADVLEELSNAISALDFDKISQICQPKINK